jgi:tyrosine-protein phosphatase YwqE
VGLLSNIFKKQPKLEPIDYSILKTDLHSHLIPGIDDGSKSVDDSIEMLNRFSQLGFKKVITTPHVMSDFYKNTPEIILDGLEIVREAIKENNIPIEIEAAAEYYLDFHLDELTEKKNILTFGDNHVLFELSFTAEPTRIKETIFNFITEGYKPILAHVERYPFYFNEWKTIEDLVDRGTLLQLNLNSLSGQYGPQVKKMGEQLIDKDMINVVGSDCHHIGHLNLLESLRTNPHVHKIVNKPNLLNKTL